MNIINYIYNIEQILFIVKRCCYQRQQKLENVVQLSCTAFQLFFSFLSDSFQLWLQWMFKSNLSCSFEQIFRFEDARLSLGLKRELFTRDLLIGFVTIFNFILHHAKISYVIIRYVKVKQI
ncbi:Hypothetical_protein [Hexamita inflata]|uniref:Hypothetical_protein n=1 Tax=Hexamita inflata TaxID=28002 RepID=A0ABP1GDS0_9EUKA